MIAKIDSARAAGQDVGATMYPYTAGRTTSSSCIPPWAHADGKLLDHLRDPATRARIKAEMIERDRRVGESLSRARRRRACEVVGFTVDSLKKYEGKRLAEIAAAWNKDWADALMDLTLLENAIGSGR